MPIFMILTQALDLSRGRAGARGKEYAGSNRRDQSVLTIVSALVGKVGLRIHSRLTSLEGINLPHAK